MTDSDTQLENIELLNILYKDLFRRVTTKDYKDRSASNEEFDFNDYTFGQEIFINKLNKYPIGETLPSGVSLSLTDTFTVNGTSFGGTLGYPNGSTVSSTTFLLLNVVDSTNAQTYPDVNFILPQVSSAYTAYSNNYVYQERLSSGGYYIAQLAPGGFVRDLSPNIRHYHRLILSPIDLPSDANDMTPIDVTNSEIRSRTHAFSAFDRNGNNILKNAIPSNFSGYTNNIDHYSTFVSTLQRASIQYFDGIGVLVHKYPSSSSTGNYIFNFRTGILFFHDSPDGAFFQEFPPIISFFSYIGPIGLENLSGGENNASTINVLDKDDISVTANNSIFENLTTYLQLNEGDSTIISINIIVTGSDSSTDGGYILKGIYSKLKGENIYTVNQEYNNSNVFTGSILTDNGTIKITNVTASDITVHMTINKLNLI